MTWNVLRCLQWIYKIYKKTKILDSFKKTLSLSIVYSKCAHEYERKFKIEESVEILKILRLINNIDEN